MTGDKGDRAEIERGRWMDNTVDERDNDGC